MSTYFLAHERGAAHVVVIYYGAHGGRGACLADAVGLGAAVGPAKVVRATVI